MAPDERLRAEVVTTAPMRGSEISPVVHPQHRRKTALARLTSLFTAFFIRRLLVHFML